MQIGLQPTLSLCDGCMTGLSGWLNEREAAEDDAVPVCGCGHPPLTHDDSSAGCMALCPCTSQYREFP